MAADDRWVFLAYRIPREPSTPRIAVWRRLKRLGVAHLVDALVALPLDARNREQLEWAAQEIAELGGEASVWIAKPTSAADAELLRSRLVDAISAEYAEIAKQARTARRHAIAARRRTLKKLRAELDRVRRRDYFPPPEREQAHSAVEALATQIEEQAA